MTGPKLTGEMIDEMGDDALATIAHEWREEGKYFLKGAEQALFELERRLESRGATVLETDNWSGLAKSGGYTNAIEHDEDFYEELVAAGVEDGRLLELWAIRPITRVWDHRQLNELHKQGGKVAEIIDKYRRRTPRPRTLELRAKVKEEA